MFSKLYREMQEHALRDYPLEACGLVAGGEYHPCPNRAVDPTQGFQISFQKQAAVAKRHGSIEAVFHSHPDGEACPSQHDMQQQVAMDVPWVMMSTDGRRCSEPFEFGDQLPIPDLLKRPFRHGVTDCYALVRDWYRINRKVTLPEYPRNWDWWTQGEDLYRANFRKAGFHQIRQEEVQIGDVFLAQIRSRVPNHAGVYIGGGLVIHHLSGARPFDPSRYSERRPIAGWQSLISTWLRYSP